MTTREPGASEVFTQGLLVKPSALALRASRPAATSTAGFDVFVQLVMAAINTAPSFTSKLLPSTVAAAAPVALGFFCVRSAAIFFTAPS